MVMRLSQVWIELHEKNKDAFDSYDRDEISADQLVQRVDDNKVRYLEFVHYNYPVVDYIKWSSTGRVYGSMYTIPLGELW